MTLRRIALASMLPGGLLVAAIGVGACGSSETATTPPGDDGPFKTNGANGVKISRTEACARFVAAALKKADALKCSLTPVPACPDVVDALEATLRAKNPTLCIDGYDEGVVSNCEKRIATYTTCEDFPTKGCALTVIPKPAGTSCDTDAGADSGADTFETSPLDDAAADAGGGG
jgi:hypothetical protein